MDGRVCFLCMKLEAIFLYGLKRTPATTSSSSSTTTSINANSSTNGPTGITTSLIANGSQQFNSMIKRNSILKSTGNLISHLLDDSKLPIAQQIKSNIESFATGGQNEISFWPFVRNFLSRFDIERFELLAHIKTDVGRQRAWIRCCLNENCLERYTLAILANPNLIRDYYDESSFLLDTNYTTTFPMLLSGLQSILFAINLDNPNLNIPTKLNQQPKTTSSGGGGAAATAELSSASSPPIRIASGAAPNTASAKTKSSPMSSSFNGNSLATIEATTIKLRKKSSFNSATPVLLANNNNNSNNNNTSSNSSSSAANLNSRRVKKNNVIVSDEEAEAEADAESKVATASTADLLLQLNGHHDDAEFDFTVSEEPVSMSNQPVAKPASILSNPINYKKQQHHHQQQQSEESGSKSGQESSNSDEAAPGSPESMTSEKTSAAVGGASDFETCNLIPITSSSFSVNINPNLADNLSMNSYQSENSNDINFGMGAQAHRAFDQNSPPLSSQQQHNNDSISPPTQRQTSTTSTTTTTTKTMTPTTSSSALGAEAATTKRSDQHDNSGNTENLSLAELREVVLTMIGRKDACEQANRSLRASLNDELAKSSGLLDKVHLLEKELANCKHFYDNRIQTIENENKLLKDQLKKYVSAVQLMRSPAGGSASANEAAVSGGGGGGGNLQPMPALNSSLHRDYSYEAEQYEKKLIQVAEMHGELMEFNSRLHSIINLKNIQIERLTNELVELRGPLPTDLVNQQLDERAASESADTVSITNMSTALISIWIPSAFLRSENSGSHHVYQVYIRIKDEEWNIFRRYSHFHTLHAKLKEKYPIVTTLNFPKKKAIGNKDVKLVETRRKLLQDYLRKIINLLLQIDRDLNAKPCKETLVKAIPFLSDLHFMASGNQPGSNAVTSARSNMPTALSSHNIVNSWSGGGPPNLSQLVRNPSNAFLPNGPNVIAAHAAAAGINSGNSVSSSPSTRLPNELLYTGL